MGIENHSEARSPNDGLMATTQLPRNTAVLLKKSHVVAKSKANIVKDTEFLNSSSITRHTISKGILIGQREFAYYSPEIILY